MDSDFAKMEPAAAQAGPAPVRVAERFRAVAVFADDLKEWRCEFTAEPGAVTRSPVQTVEKLFHALLGEKAEINFAIAHESARALTASGKTRRNGDDAVPFVLMITGAE